MQSSESTAESGSALLQAWDEALGLYETRQASGQAGTLTEFVSSLPTEVRPFVRQELEGHTAHPPLPAPSRFERIRELGRGSFGRVDLMFDHHLGRQVAIKTARPDVDWNTVRQLEEGRRLAALRHESIVPLYDIVAGPEGDWRIVSAYVEGESLAIRLGSGRLPPGDAARIALGLCSALQHAHDQGVVHRDVKPSNILLDSLGRPHLLDFGLALLEGASRRTPGIAGTPGYRPPELERDAGLADPRSDVFSLGVVLHEMLTGSRPTAGAGRPRLARGESPLLAVCRRATAASPEERFSSANEMATAIRQALPETVASRSPSRREWWTLALAAPALLLALGVVLQVPSDTAPRVVVTIPCSAPGADMAFVPLAPDGRPQFNRVQWTRPETPLTLAPGDYLVTAIAGSRFSEVQRHVPDPRKPLPQRRVLAAESKNLKLPGIDLAGPQSQDLRSVSTNDGLALLLPASLPTLGDYVAAMKVEPIRLRRRGLPPDTPLTGLSYDDALLFAEVSGMRLPEPEELYAVREHLKFPPELTTVWTTRKSGTSDANGRELIRLWTIPRGTAALVGSDLLQLQANRSSFSTTNGVVLVRSAKPRVSR